MRLLEEFRSGTVHTVFEAERLETILGVVPIKRIF